MGGALGSRPTLGHEQEAAKGKAGKGAACIPATMTGCAAAQLPLPGAARKRHGAPPSVSVALRLRPLYRFTHGQRGCERPSETCSILRTPADVYENTAQHTLAGFRPFHP